MSGRPLFFFSKLKKFVTHKIASAEQIKCGRKKSRAKSGDGAKTRKKPH
jgi:hypothetical protein